MYLKPGIALLLIFIGVKMLISPVIELPVTASLAVIALVVAGAIGGSRLARAGPPGPGPARTRRRPGEGRVRR